MDARRLAAKDDLEGLKIALNSDLVELTARMDVGFAQVESRFAQLEATLTRRMVTIMGAWTILVGSTVGWVSALLR